MCQTNFQKKLTWPLLHLIYQLKKMLFCLNHRRSDDVNLVKMDLFLRCADIVYDQLVIRMNTQYRRNPNYTFNKHSIAGRALYSSVYKYVYQVALGYNTKTGGRLVRFESERLFLLPRTKRQKEWLRFSGVVKAKEISLHMNITRFLPLVLFPSFYFNFILFSTC